MKQKILLFLGLALSQSVFGQNTFSDNFDSYTLGSALGPQSPNWTTWSGAQGGADDIVVSNTDAHSGTQSLYFYSVLANGGPADIVLPFGGIRENGSFTFTTWLKIPTGKGGYFNFQGATALGSLYTLNTFFEANGTLEIINSKESVLMSTFPQNAWFEFKYVANLNTNTWEVFIDNVSKGKFQNADFTIGSVDFFATGATDAFWVDDVSYDYTPYTLPTVNGAASFINIANGLVTQTRNPSVTVRNLGTTPITSFKLNMNANGVNTSQDFSGVSITSGASYVANLTSPISLIAGLNTFTATISNVNGQASDGDATDDVKTISFTPTTPGADKLVVSEEATGTWCGWCPRGAVMLENMHKDFKGFFQGIAVHNGDPMVVSNYDGQMGVSGYPSALTDRGTPKDPSTIRADFMQQIVLTPVAKLKNGANYNSGTGELVASVTYDFKTATTGNYRVACVIVEDSVKSTAAGYAQANYYAGGGNGVMGGYELLPSTVPASQMQYDHVARAISPSFQGMLGFPATISSGYKQTHNFNFNVSAWNRNKLHIVGLLIAPNGKIENASSTTLDEAIANGFVLGLDDSKILPEAISLYPNPAQDVMKLELNVEQAMDANVVILDITGKSIFEKSIQVQKGLNVFPIQVSGLASGQYTLNFIANKEQKRSLKFVKE